MTLPTSLPLVVVGAGPSGLGCAIELAATHTVELVDRTPVTGGETGWRDAAIQRLTAEATEAGVRLLLGCAALRWQAEGLLLATPGRMEWRPASTLFYAGGLRPATAVDLGINGDRPAGVIAATVAAHLLESGVRLWASPAIVGTGPWAAGIAHDIKSAGGRVTAVTLDDAAPEWADHTFSEASALVVSGRHRVEELTATIAGRRQTIPCDAVSLAAEPRPNRNVDGALHDPSPGVVFVQPLDGTSVAERSERGRDIARNWLYVNGGTT